jgi:pSer/pThr/pTyr-binding forkhead associated (FHA) protein
VAGDGNGTTHELTGDKPITLGTKEENQIPLKGEGISRYHAQVHLEKGAWVLKDLGSRNGTFVGDRKVDDHELAPGDVIMIGTVYLRFEHEAKAGEGSQAPVMEQVKELFELLKRDPKGFVKSPKGKRAIMIALALLIAFVLFAPGGGDQGYTGTSGASDDPTTLPHQTIELIQKDQAQKARDLIARVRSTFKPGQDRPFLQDIDDLAKVWLDRGAPLTFSWKDALTTIDRCLKNGANELDKESTDWLEKARKEVEEEEPNGRAIYKAQSDLAAAQAAAGRKDGVKDAIANYRSAHATYSRIPKKSCLYGPAQAQAEKVRVVLLGLLRQEADRLAALDPPPWQDALERYNEASEYANTLEEKLFLRKKIDECQANQRDEEAFARAVDIVQARLTSRYEEAIKLLSNVARTSRVYPDAQTYLHWIQADRDVRFAKTAYDEGSWDKARSLLEGALRVQELGPDAKSSVTRRIESWQKVVDSWTAGLAASARGDDALAISKLEEVLKLEPNTKNRYHILAEGELNNVHDRSDKWIDQRLQDGLSHLEKGRYREAKDCFKYVIAHSKSNPGRLATITKTVQELNQRKRLFKDCKKRWEANEDAMYDGILEVLYVIGSFLPESDPDRAPARELYKKVKQRLKTATDQSKPDDDDRPPK